MNNWKNGWYPLSLISVALLPVTVMANPVIPANSSTSTEKKIERIEVKGKPQDFSLLAQADDQAAREVRDLFSGLSDISIGGGDRQGRRLFLRGVEGSNLNITVDGARQGANLYNHRGGMLGLDPAILKQASIHAGPAKATDGAGAMAGSIQMTTKDAQDFLTDQQSLGGFARAGYASAQDANTLNAALALQHQNGIGLLLYAGGTNADLQRIGGGSKIPFSGYDDRNQLIKLSSLGRHSWRVGHEVNTTTGLNFQQRGDYPYQVQPPIESRPPRLQTLERQSSHADYVWLSDSDLLKPEIKIYHQTNAWDALDNFGEAYDSSGYGMTLKNTMLLSSASKLVLGMDYLAERGDAYGNNLPNKQNVVDYHNLGYFVQGEWQQDSVALTAGMRRDRYHTVYGQDDAAGWILSPNLQGQWQLTSHWQLFAGYGTSARGFGTMPVHFARNIQPNVTAPLKPERAQQQEAGIRLGQLQIAGLGLSADISYFKNSLRDFIIYQHGGSGGLGNRPVTSISNQAAVITFEGVHSKLVLQGQQWSGELGFSQFTSRNLPLLPQHSARAGAELGDKAHVRVSQQLNAAWEWSYQLTVQQGLTLDSREHKAGYSTHDVQLNWQAMPQLQVTLALQNLTDKRYISHSTLRQNGFATEEPGRDIRFALNYAF